RRAAPPGAPSPRGPAGHGGGHGGRPRLHRRRPRAAPLAPFDPTATHLPALPKGASPAPLPRTRPSRPGGRSRLIWGVRASWMAGVIPVTIAVSLSIPLGLLAGYAGGWIDSWMMRLNDAMLAIPFLIVAIALAAFLGPSLRNAMIAIGIASLPTFLRLARGTV